MYEERLEAPGLMPWYDPREMTRSELEEKFSKLEQYLSLELSNDVKVDVTDDGGKVIVSPVRGVISMEYPVISSIGRDGQRADISVTPFTHREARDGAFSSYLNLEIRLDDDTYVVNRVNHVMSRQINKN